MTRNERKFWQRVGSSIKHHRRTAGLTQQMLADSIGVSRPHIPNMESGRSRINAWQIVQIAYILGVQERKLLHEYPLTKTKCVQY